MINQCYYSWHCKKLSFSNCKYFSISQTNGYLCNKKAFSFSFIIPKEILSRSGKY